MTEEAVTPASKLMYLSPWSHFQYSLTTMPSVLYSTYISFISVSIDTCFFVVVCKKSHFISQGFTISWLCSKQRKIGIGIKVISVILFVFRDLRWLVGIWEHKWHHKVFWELAEFPMGSVCPAYIPYFAILTKCSSAHCCELLNVSHLLP